MDHHQLLGNAIEISEPRMVEIQPWGSTATMLAFKFFQAKMTIPWNVAGCLLGAILSDTVYLSFDVYTYIFIFGNHSNLPSPFFSFFLFQLN